MRYIIVLVALLQASSTLAATENSSATSTAPNTSSSSSTKIEELTPNKKFEADKRLTDLELRAAGGSMSRWSLKAELGYSGAAVNSLYEQNRPNPNHSSGDYRTKLTGATGLRYRLSEKDTLYFSTGFTWYTPLEAMTGQPVKKEPGAADDFSTANPQFSYDHSWIAGPVQMRENFKVAAITDSYYVKRGENGSVGFSHNMKYKVGTTPLTLGLEIAPTYYTFNRDYIHKDGRISRYYISVNPNVSYRLTSNLDATYAMTYSYQNARAEASWSKWVVNMITARAGFGWSVTPEIYLNPYLSFFTQEPKWDTTTLSLGTVFSIF
jgi:hypothetical protein